jgi:hypothetical protein
MLDKEPIWEPKSKIGSRTLKISLQQSTYTGDLLWVAWETQPKYEHPLFCKLIYRKDSLLGPDLREDACRIGIKLFACSTT